MASRNSKCFVMVVRLFHTFHVAFSHFNWYFAFALALAMSLGIVDRVGGLLLGVRGLC